MDKEYLKIFPVLIQRTELELNIDSLIKFCYEMKRKNEKGVQISNIGGWQSDNIVDETHTEFVKLKNKIEDAANIYHHDIQLKKTYNQKISNIWININQKGHSNETHNHAYSIFSGAFYLTKGETAPIVFQHPFRDINTYFWNEIEEWNEVNSGEWSILPEPNRLLIFPAWLWHKVSMNEENIDRITFSFNTVMHEKGNE
jgi:uncharacterized protein (TIGR02466 family)